MFWRTTADWLTPVKSLKLGTFCFHQSPSIIKTPQLIITSVTEGNKKWCWLYCGPSKRVWSNSHYAGEIHEEQFRMKTTTASNLPLRMSKNTNEVDQKKFCAPAAAHPSRLYELLEIVADALGACDTGTFWWHPHSHAPLYRPSCCH